MERSGDLIAVVGASGGVGASTFAAAIALNAAAAGARTCLVDADPMGGGLDVVFSTDSEPAARWRIFARATGDLDPPGLTATLPEVFGVRLLSHDREPTCVRPLPTAVQSVTAALRRGHDLVVADLSREPLPERDVLLSAASEVLVVVSGRVRSVAAGLALIGDLRNYAKTPRLFVARGSERALGAHRIADSLGLELEGEWLRDEELAADLEFGDVSRLLSSCRGDVGATAAAVAQVQLRTRAVA